jgi:hypothetical protein
MDNNGDTNGDEISASSLAFAYQAVMIASMQLSDSMDVWLANRDRRKERRLFVQVKRLMMNMLRLHGKLAFELKRFEGNGNDETSKGVDKRV